MGLFDLFSGPKVECPRCLGKGEVDWNDIKRLKQDLRWIPGKCAYCNGTGKTFQQMISKVDINESFLTTDLSSSERKKLIDGDSSMRRYAKQQETRIADFICQVEYLHFTGNLSVRQIADFYLTAKSKPENDAAERRLLVDYIERIIQHKKEQ
jgi:hypothetical protein